MPVNRAWVVLSQKGTYLECVVVLVKDIMINNDC